MRTNRSRLRERQQNHLEMIDAAAPEHQASPPDRWKILLDFEVVEREAAL